MNTAINETLSRTILTSSLTLVTVLSLLFFGGPVLHSFALAMLVGIVVGTYSSSSSRRRLPFGSPSAATVACARKWNGPS